MIKLKRKIDNAVAGHIRKFLLTFDKEEMKPIPEDQRIEVVRMKVRTKEEFDKLKASLEEQGYQLTCKEFFEEDIDDLNYSATILGEKRIQLTEEELRPKRDPEKEKKRELIVNIGVKAMWWIIIFGFFWIWFSILKGALILSFKEVLRFLFG